MTYSVAWKSGSEVFMVADSALTSKSDAPKLDIQESSFGEKSFLNEQKAVEEKFVKLFRQQGVGIAMAGDTDLYIRIVASFYEKLAQGFTPEVALREAIFLNSPFPKGQVVQLAVGYCDKGPHLISFDPSRESQIVIDSEDIVHMGSIPEAQKQIAEQYIRSTAAQTIFKPKHQLSAVLGFLQSSDVFRGLLCVGIGGVYSGLYIDTKGAHWQPDMVFSYDDKYVATCFRHDCLIVNSPVIGQSRCLLSYVPPRPRESLMEQTSKAIEKGKKVVKNAEFEYLVASSSGSRKLVLVEMARERKHRLVWLSHFENGDGKSGLQVMKFPELRKMLNTQNGSPSLQFCPYEKPIIKSVPANKKIVREVSHI